MNTVTGLLLERKDVNKISNREIAALAGVNSALINYYYQSKENLLSKAVSAFSVENYELCLIAISSELKAGSLYTNSVILPILKEVFGESKNETMLKLMAMQIVIPLQVLFLTRLRINTSDLIILSHSMTKAKNHGFLGGVEFVAIISTWLSCQEGF